MTTDILVVGIGGQGVMTAAEALARAALAAGLQCTKTEVAGMSQRGGVVCSQVRMGVQIAASEIRPGAAALLIAFEAAEGLRWCHYLALNGSALIDCWRAVPPVISSGLDTYPADPVGAMRAMGVEVTPLDARELAGRLGDSRLANSVMLGAAAGRLPYPPQVLRDEIVRRFGRTPALAQLNAAAFEAGRELGH